MLYNKSRKMWSSSLWQSCKSLGAPRWQFLLRLKSTIIPRIYGADSATFRRNNYPQNLWHRLYPIEYHYYTKYYIWSEQFFPQIYGTDSMEYHTYKKYLHPNIWHYSWEHYIDNIKSSLRRRDGKDKRQHRKNCKCCPGYYLIVNH